MPDFNQVTLIGRLTRDPTIKYTPSQAAVCEFGLATGRKFKTASGEQREETTYVDCTVWGKGGEIFNQYMTKGKPVFITGRLKFDSWEDKNGGGKRTKLTVTVDDFQFLGGRDAGSDETSQVPPPAARQQRSNKPPAGAPVPPYDDGEQQFNDDDIPF